MVFIREIRAILSEAYFHTFGRVAVAIHKDYPENENEE